jgi:NitT/TauT family transport system ATP-binding protein
MNGIDLQNASKRFQRRGQEVTALSPTSLQLEEGSFVAIVGRSGCGKSTLLRLMAGLLPPTTGSIYVAGKRVDRPPPEARVVFQDYRESLLPWKTVRQNIIFGLRHAVNSSSAQDPEFYLEMVGLSGVGDRYPRELSGGMQQRVAIARAIASEPRFLLMDEPFSAVDALSRAKLQDATLRLWERLQLSIVFVTHDIDEALYLADRVLVLAPEGRGLLADIPVELPRPRKQIATRENEKFLRLRRHLLELVLTEEGE